MLGGGPDPLATCSVVAGLVVQPGALPDLPPARVAEKNLRPAAVIVQRLLSIDPSPCASQDQTLLAGLFGRPEFRVPAALMA